MEPQTAPNPFEGAASVEKAAEALTGLLEQRRKRPDAPSEPTPKAEEAKPAAPVAAEPEADADPEAQPSEPDADAPTDPEPKADGEPEAADDPEYEVKVNGETRKVKLGDLRKGFMLHEDYGRKSREVAAERQQFAQARGHAQQAIQAQLQEVGFLANTLLTQLAQEEQGTNWEELKAKDPARYAAAVADVHRKRDLLQRSFAAYQNSESARGQQHNEGMRQVLEQQAQRLPELIPDWHDEKTAQSEKRQLAEYLSKDNLLTSDEIAGITDARFVALARKAMQFDRLAEQRKEVVKKIEKVVPKLQKGGVGNSVDAKEQIIKQQQARLRKSGRIDDFAQLLLARQSKE